MRTENEIREKVVQFDQGIVLMKNWIINNKGNPLVWDCRCRIVQLEKSRNQLLWVLREN